MIGWGVPFGLLTPLVVLAVGGEVQLLLSIYKFFVPVSLVGGLIFGALMWRNAQQARATGIDTIGTRQRTG